MDDSSEVYDTLKEYFLHYLLLFYFQPRIEQYCDKINKIISAKKVSWRVIFMLRDVVDLRDNKWVPRREEHVNPKTIDQIHKEAEMEKQQEQKLVSQLPAKDKQQLKKGSSGKEERYSEWKKGTFVYV